MKIRPVEAELFQADERADRNDEVNGHSRNFANVPKNPTESDRAGPRHVGALGRLLIWCPFKPISLNVTA